jgi:hypothetical protein
VESRKYRAFVFLNSRYKLIKKQSVEKDKGIKYLSFLYAIGSFGLLANDTLTSFYYDLWSSQRPVLDDEDDSVLRVFMARILAMTRRPVCYYAISFVMLSFISW